MSWRSGWAPGGRSTVNWLWRQGRARPERRGKVVPPTLSLPHPPPPAGETEHVKAGRRESRQWFQILELHTFLKFLKVFFICRKRDTINFFKRVIKKIIQAVIPMCHFLKEQIISSQRIMSYYMWFYICFKCGNFGRQISSNLVPWSQ